MVDRPAKKSVHDFRIPWIFCCSPSPFPQQHEILTNPASEPSTDLAISELISSAHVIASAVATNLNNPAG
jgi:hypothetical protein